MRKHDVLMDSVYYDLDKMIDKKSEEMGHCLWIPIIFGFRCTAVCRNRNFLTSCGLSFFLLDAKYCCFELFYEQFREKISLSFFDNEVNLCHPSYYSFVFSPSSLAICFSYLFALLG